MNHKAWNDFEKLRFETFSTIQMETIQQKYILLLATRVTELCRDTIELIVRKRIYSVPIILRSAVESYIDMKCIIKSESYITEMNRSFQFYMSKKEGKRDKVDLMSVWGKFKLAGETKTYEGLYADLCLVTHGSIGIAASDHASGANISIGRNPNQEHTHIYINHIFLLAAKCLIECLSFFGFSKEQLASFSDIKENALNGQYA